MPPNTSRAMRNADNAGADPSTIVAFSWKKGPMPPPFWTDAANRRAYMDWLGEKLNFRCPADWHRVRAADFEKHGGSSLLKHYFGKSIFRAVRETFPEHEWLEWLFDATPRGFWTQPENRVRFLKWLGEKLGFATPDDWYRITAQDFRQNGAREMLIKEGSPAQIVMEAFPAHD